MQSLTSYETKLNRLKEDRDNIVKAKEALELSDPAHPSPHADRLRVAMEELHDLKSVWNALKPLYTEVDELKEKPWLSVQPKKLRQQIDGLLNNLKDLPANYRNYDSYEYAKRLLQGYAKVFLFLPIAF